MEINCVWEHNGNDTLLFSSNLIGAYTRGASKEIAVEKMIDEARSYLRYTGKDAPNLLSVKIVQEKESALQIRDADSDVIFDSEKDPLSSAEYERLKALALKSASDFLSLYEAVPDRDKSVLPLRTTFYGQAPRTAREMYEHTKNVNAYYFGEIGVDADNSGTIYESRKRGFEVLERAPDYLNKGVFRGSYDELWSLGKVLRRFIWHDRIHAKAMYRMANKTFGEKSVPDIFMFGIGE